MMARRPKTLDELQGMFAGIYTECNDKHYHDTDLMFRLYEIVMKCLESLRKENDAEIIERLPHIFSWLCAFCNRSNIHLSEAVWHKYPNVCPYGLEERGCVCITREEVYNPTLPELLRFRNDYRNMPSTMKEFQDMFDRIYGPVNKVKSKVAVLCHLAEEVGEVGKDYRTKNREGLEAEVADTFAWLCGLSARLAVDLEDLVWKSYPGVCNSCHKDVCVGGGN
ncbi:MAG: hypothetical protein UX72_C0007G0016 [Parcubacteria group bacterium GW2011_GWA2_47_10]|nr:MAG: hypothetical protein UX72_C0007G0016 [Parcubacteria group bacterium GW2011_GWA2_47_10]